ncbi:hypothetical protein PN36_00080 [Candidatus Thiomargarita nelsonii]|uniref:Uncharacterized protein n=1 Tax=Candidatus Thiomargarita nelsonii TaxID=1003181 RepID=A0A4E0QX02_9GAMM|nr:hypothetical protein PN36_00080 [Candidatus Thiomargarita nelsonii]
MYGIFLIVVSGISLRGFPETIITKMVGFAKLYPPYKKTSRSHALRQCHWRRGNPLWLPAPTKNRILCFRGKSFRAAKTFASEGNPLWLPLT